MQITRHKALTGTGKPTQSDLVGFSLSIFVIAGNREATLFALTINFPITTDFDYRPL